MVLRGRKRPIGVFVALALVAGVLTACGEGSSTTPSTTTAPNQGAKQKSATGSQEKGSETAPRESKENDATRTKNSADEKGGGSPDVSTPLRVSGGGSKQFRFKGGDNSIQEYGEESDKSELQAAAKVVHGFYVARSEEDWSRACSYLAKSMVSQLEMLAGQSPELKGKGCAPLLKAFTRPLPASVRRELTVVDAGSLRREGERGFLIYYDNEHKPYAMPLEDESGTWKLTLLSATPLG